MRGSSKALLGLVLLAGCASPIVGAECAEGILICEGRCVDPMTDRDHCGACGVECDVGESCFAGVCSATGDAGPDAGPRDAEPRDAELDARDIGPNDAPNPFPDGALPDGALPDGSVDDGGVRDGGDGSVGDAGPCSCDLGEECCSGSCVRTERDPRNCGGCGIVCEADEFCADGICSPLCDPPLTLCGELCVDLLTDPDNCGRCGRSCPTGICIDGMCSDGPAGHVVLIGHNYRVSRRAMRRVAGNAAFLSNFVDGDGTDDLEVLVYVGDATQTSGADRALDERGSWNRVVSAGPDSVPAELADADTFLVYSQTGADDATLRDLGMRWATALMSFLDRGGSVVVLDADGANAGTWQILDAAGLLTVASRTDVSGDRIDVVDTADAVAAGVAPAYRGENDTVWFDTTEEVNVFEHPDGPVVIHKTF